MNDPEELEIDINDYVEELRLIMRQNNAVSVEMEYVFQDDTVTITLKRNVKKGVKK